MTRRKTEAINLRMSAETKELLRLAADREHRTLSNMIEHLLIDYCERHGIAPPVQTEHKPASSRRKPVESP